INVLNRPGVPCGARTGLLAFWSEERPPGCVAVPDRRRHVEIYLSLHAAMSTLEGKLRASAATGTYTFTSESVSEGHPDKVCDYIAHSVLDAHLTADPASRVACEVLCKEDNVILAGEITSDARVDYDALVREVIAEIGYVDGDQPF